jgi:cinnamyl-alcohol dehydrogenase
MASDKSENCPAWAAKDESGVLSPYKFKRRYEYHNDNGNQRTPSAGMLVLDVIHIYSTTN